MTATVLSALLTVYLATGIGTQSNRCLRLNLHDGWYTFCR